MAEQIGSLFVPLALESASFVSGLKRATQTSEQSGAAITNAIGKAGTAIKGFLAIASLDALIGAGQRAFDYADGIVDLADRTGASTKVIQEFGYAAQMSGSSVDSARAGLEKFTKQLGEAEGGGKKQLAMFKELGVTSFDVDTALRQAADGVSKLDTRQKQLAATTDLFGKKQGDLTALMAQGSQGFNDLAGRAATLGVVLGDDVLRNAGQVNDQLDTMKMILDAQFANAVVQNADAIASLASGVTQVTSALLHFWQQNPRAAMAVLGGIGGATIAGGPGLAIGAGAGFVGGELMAEGAEDGNMGLAFRRKKLLEADRRRTASLTTKPLMQATGGMFTLRDDQHGPNAAKAQAELDKQARLFRQARAIAEGKGKPAPGRDTRSLTGVSAGGPKGKTGKSAADQAKEAAERQAAFERDLSRSTLDLLRAQEDMTFTAEDRFALQRDQLEMERKASAAAIAADGPAGTKRYSAAQVEQLGLLNDQIAMQKADLINHKENEFLAGESLRAGTAALQNQADLLNVAQGNARTGKERAQIELRLLDLQYEREKLELGAVLASRESTDAERKIAEARLALLPAIKAGQAKSIERSNLSPLGRWLDELPGSAAEINEALESVEVRGLDGLNDGLVDAIRGVGDLGGAFRDMANQVISDLIRIGVQQAITKPLGEALFGGGSGGGGRVLGSVLGSVLGGKANGGMGNRGRWLVGEHGPEIIDAGGPFKVVPASKLDGVRGGGSREQPSVTVYGVNDPHMVRRTVVEGIAQATPYQSKLASDRTRRDLRRPSMRP